jgi:hypothetical protein
LEDQIICTTHVQFLNLGLSKAELISLTSETIGPHMLDVAIDFGRYMGMLGDAFGLDVPATKSELMPVAPEVWFRDLKSKRFYDSVAANLAPGRTSVCLLLTSLLSQINTARLVVPVVTGSSSIAALKIGFVSLYHAASSLQRLLDEDDADPFLTSGARQRLHDVLDMLHIRNVRANRALRNSLVHYGIGKAAAPLLSPNLPLFGLIEAHTSGQSITSLNQDIDLGLCHMDAGLRTLLPQSLTPAEKI